MKTAVKTLSRSSVARPPSAGRRPTVRLVAAGVAAAALLAMTGWVARPRDLPTRDASPQVLLDAWRARADVPAVVVAMGGPDRHTWVGASGTPLRRGRVPVTHDARFRIASITKTFVATVVLQLVQEHRLAIEDRLDRYVPDFPGAGDITIGQLLDHTSGVPDYGQIEGFGQRLLRDRQRRFTSAELISLVAGSKREFAPGTDYAYSNTGYLLLGEVIASVTHQSWAAQVRRRILDPLQLADTYIAGAEPPSGVVVPGYFDTDDDGDEENVETGGPWPSLESSEGAAGAIVSTARDLVTFGQALFHGRLLSPSSMRSMAAEHPGHPRNDNYGYGVQIAHLGYDTTVVGHGGFLPGFRSLLWYVPSRDLVVVVLTNDTAASPTDLAELLIRGVPQGQKATEVSSRS